MASKNCEQIDKLLSKGKIPKVISLMYKGDPETICYGIEKLASVETEDARNLISTYLEDANEDVKIAAIKAHAVIGMDYCKTRLQYRYRVETDEKIKALIMESIQIINQKK